MDSSFSLIGMSNTGKSYWREQAASVGFVPFCCDDRIEQLLAPHLETQGFKGIGGVARWMGQPYEPQSAKNQAFYLAQEKAAMREALRALRKSRRPMVIDTTGSVIYLDDDILKELACFTRVVMIGAPSSLQDELYNQYIAQPKPVIWGDAYQPLPGEAPEVALARCYRILLQRRSDKYFHWASVVVDYRELREPGFDIDRFLRKIGLR